MADAPQDHPMATREELVSAFKNILFPTDRDELLMHARVHEADGSLSAVIESIPPGIYASVEEVLQALEPATAREAEIRDYTHDDPERRSMGQSQLQRDQHNADADQYPRPGMEERGP